MKHFVIDRLDGALPIGDWAGLAARFSASDPIEFLQGWKEFRDTDFRPTQVRLLWAEDALWVLADLEDEDIHNSTTQRNKLALETGDVFEMFLSDAACERYLELHVTPGNVAVQLEWPDYDAINRVRAGKKALESLLREERLFESWVGVEAERGRWMVLARVPAATICGSPTFDRKTILKCSFSRYDAFRDGRPVVFSASSPHRELNYHRQHEWSSFVLGGTGP